jgi:hypothetical protein
VTARRGLTIRLRLTLLIGAVLILAGSILLGLTYVLVRHSVNSNPTEVRAAIAHRLGVNPNVLRTIPRSSAARPPGAHHRRVLFEDVQRQINNRQPAPTDR